MTKSDYWQREADRNRPGKINQRWPWIPHEHCSVLFHNQRYTTDHDGNDLAEGASGTRAVVAPVSSPGTKMDGFMIGDDRAGVRRQDHPSARRRAAAIAR